MPPSQLAGLGRKARASVVKWAALDRVVGTLLELYHGARPTELDGAD